MVRAALLASGTAVLVASALALRSKAKTQRTAAHGACCKSASPGMADQQKSTAAPREHFRISRVRSNTGPQQWTLEGHGRYQCFLLFDTWAQAVEQATFRLEHLNADGAELLAVAH